MAGLILDFLGRRRHAEKGIWYFGVQVRLFIRGGGKRKRRDVFDFRDTPRLIYRTNYVNYLGLLYRYTRG